MKSTKGLRRLTPPELEEKEREFKKELLKYKVQAAMGAAKNSGKLKQTKKDIARILTLLQEKNKEKEVQSK